MPERDTATQPLHDLLSAFGLLTRLPLPQTTRHRANAAWCWPLVGLGVGAVALGIGWLGLQAGVAPGTAAALTMGAGVMVTGALHQDGLADTADGLFGGWTPERRLDIMKDSHIGSYGTLALIIVSLALWSALGGLVAAEDWVAIAAAAALSRAPMAVTMAALPNARKAGLSSSVGRPSRGAAAIAVVLAVLICVGLTQDLRQTLAMVVACAVASLWVAVTAQRKIGGQTGDILGATQQLSLVAALIAAQM